MHRLFGFSKRIMKGAALACGATVWAAACCSPDSIGLTDAGEECEDVRVITQNDMDIPDIFLPKKVCPQGPEFGEPINP